MPLSESSDLGMARLGVNSVVVHLPGMNKVMSSVHNTETKNPYETILVQYTYVISVPWKAES